MKLIFNNPDKPRNIHEKKFILRTELRRHQTNGKKNLIIKKGKIITISIEHRLFSNRCCNFSEPAGKPLNGSEQNYYQISIICFNARSVCNNINEFHDILKGSTEYPFDILCITETWLSDGVSDNLEVGTFPCKIFRCDRSHRVSGDCAILIRDTLTSSLINLPINSFENVQVTAIEIMIGSRIMVIYCIYIILQDIFLLKSQNCVISSLICAVNI